MTQLAANLAFLFAERPFMQRFAAAAAAGFSAVELQTPYDHPPSEVRAELERLKLTMLGLNTATGRPGEMGLAAVPGREQDFAALFDQALAYVTAIGGSSVHCLAGSVLPEQRPAAERVFVNNLRRAADLAAAHGILLLIEPINARDRPDYFLSRPEQAAGIIAGVGRPNVKMQFDFYHAQIGGGDIIRRFEQHLPAVAHVQIASVPARAEPDDGEINYPAVLAAVDRAGYAGFVSCEYKPRGRTEDGLGWARAYGVSPRG